jgi:AhpC/TSA family
MKILSKATLLAATFVASACSGKSGAGPGAPDSGLAAKDATSASYPAGPYGVGLGNVVEDATFFGYPSFDNTTLGSVALHDYYNPGGSTMTTAGVPVNTILLTVGAVWCNPCVEEAKVLAAVAAKFLPAGVQIIQDLYQGKDRNTGAAATQAELDKWVANYSLPFPVFIDPAKKLAPYFDVSSLPFIMLLDAHTMTSVGEEVGFGGQQGLEDFICQNAPEKPSACP